MGKSRHVVMQVVRRSSGSATHHVEFLMDDIFAERLRQLRWAASTSSATS